jgi:hypothetical protein
MYAYSLEFRGNVLPLVQRSKTSFFHCFDIYQVALDAFNKEDQNGNACWV